MIKRLLFVLVLLVVGAFAYLALRRGGPPTVPFTKVTRESLTSTLNTNGKVEPLDYAEIRAEREGAVDRVLVQRGQQVNQGQVLVELDSGEARVQLSSAEARIAEAQAQREVVQSGGRTSELTEIDSQLTRARLDLQTAQREADSLRRLVERNAATRRELTEAETLLERTRLQIQSLESRRAALVSPTDRTIAEARIRDAETGASTARRRIELGTIRTPISGTLYQFDVRAGAYLNPGDLVGTVGRLDRLRVIVYVDEPELGRVAPGMPVTITWDARPGKSWTGVVDQVPTQIVSVGTRQVGEVVCVIDNTDRELLPGTNINAEIRSGTVSQAISIPREVLRRENNQNGVLVLEGDRLAWRPVTLGISSTTRAQVTQGLQAGDAVALPTDAPLRAGDRVQPVFP